MVSLCPQESQRLVLSRSQGSGEGRQAKPGLQFRLRNVTLWGQKAWTCLDEMDMHTKPDILGAVEMHLRGTKLNQVRRRAKSMGWHMFSTPAVSSQGPGHLEGASSSLADKTFANH